VYIGSMDTDYAQSPSTDIIISYITTIDYPYPYSQTFREVDPGTQANSSNHGTRPSSVIKLSTLAVETMQEDSLHEETLTKLKLFEYRYTRYVLDPRSGFWVMVK
jgi:cation-transporting ATPase 13A2